MTSGALPRWRFDESSRGLAFPDTAPAHASSTRPIAPSPVIIDWELSTAHGWGIFGLHLALQMVRQNRGTPALLLPPDLRDAPPIAQALLLGAARAQPDLSRILADAAGHLVDGIYPAIRGLGRGLQPQPASKRLRAPRNAGVTFLEDTALSEQALAWGNAYDLLIAGSRWCAAMLEANGLAKVRTVQQGIDPSVFHPGPGSGLLSERFVIFSGGKLEYRKGQDLVVAAFRVFVRRHPEALLVAAWHNPWPRTVVSIDRMGHVRGVPEANGAGGLAIGKWLVANGIPAGSILEVAPVPNGAMGPLLRDADVAVFPNRCEGGTNLVAMEAMATGVPCILSANTGHLDLIRGDNCYPLTRQQPVAGGCPLYQGYEGWGESDVEELVERLEQAYLAREDARSRGAQAATWMHARWTWAEKITEFLDVLAEGEVL